MPTRDSILYGGDYNPEQWPEDLWPEDVRLMQEAGVNFVSLGIFSWARLQPGPHEAYDFTWLDRIMDLLHAGGVGVNLATATASPPPWLARLYPDSRPVTADGVRLEVGARQLYCPSHAAFRQRALRLVRALAERYATHPALQMWHVNNEYGCHISECFCELCAARFRTWLEERYGTLDALNDAWSTAFWSLHYGDWAEVQPPRRAPTFSNPALQLDWRRFSSDNLLGLFTDEVAVLREVTPQVPVTTNFIGFLKGLDYFEWARHEDVASLDAYPDPASAVGHLDSAAQFDLTRSLRGGQRWLLMEQATSAVNWRAENAPKPPGLMRLTSLQALAHGADAVMFFQWRASRGGAEKFHSGMVPHVGTQHSRIWNEVKALGAELPSLARLTGCHVPARVALLFDWHSWWALELDSKPSARLQQLPTALKYHAALRSLGQNVDLVAPGAPLDGYDAVVVPNAYLLTQGTAEDLRAFTRAGGTLVMGPFSGIVDERDQVQLGGYPALLRDVLGAWVEEWVPLPGGETLGLRFADGREARCDTWAEVLHPEGADVLATFEGGFLTGGAALTRHAFGQGAAYYAAADLPQPEVQALLREALTARGVPVTGVPLDLDLGVSRDEAGSVLHLLNFSRTDTRTVRLPAGGRDLQGGNELEQVVRLPPLGARFVTYPGDVSVADVRVE